MSQPVAKNWFQEIPRDITIQILYRLMPEDWTTWSRVCKLFKTLIDNKEIRKNHPQFFELYSEKIAADFKTDKQFFIPFKNKYGEHIGYGLIKNYLRISFRNQKKIAYTPDELKNIKEKFIKSVHRLPSLEL